MQFSIVGKNILRVECDCGDIYFVSLHEPGIYSPMDLQNITIKNRHDYREVLTEGEITGYMEE